VFVIDVNHHDLRNVATSINAYCDAQEKEMRAGVPQVQSSIKTAWLGADADAFNQKWAEVNAPGSVSAKFLDSLRDYALRLESCANEYENAQADAVNKAGMLLW
jgi:uncharacterized protein YukE